MLEKQKSIYGEDIDIERENKTGQRHPKSVLTDIEITDEERNHEMVYVFKSPKAGVYNPQKTDGKPYKVKGRVRKTKSIYDKDIDIETDNKTGQRHPKSVLTDIEITDEETPKTTILKENHDKEKLHRTQKPVKLCEWLIKSYSNENDLVLDFCMGSGSSIVGCKNTKRDYIGVEMNKDIFEIAKKELIN